MNLLQITQHPPTQSETDAAAVPLIWADACVAAALAALTLAVALYFAPRGFHHGFVDLGHDGYQLREVLDLAGGGVVFRDTFDQYGPLGGYLNTIGFLTFGRRLLAIKQFIALWYALTAIVLFVIARQWLNRGLASFSVLAWLSLAPFANHGIMISVHAYALLFQALGMLIALRTPDHRPARFAAIGLLAGLCWAVKQSIGVLFLAPIVLWLLIRRRRERAAWTVALGAALAACAGFAAVVGVFLTFLKINGALGDWYLQTIVFPRQFYVAGSPPHGLMDLLAVVFDQLRQPPYWIVIRVTVLLAPFMVRARGPIPRDHVPLMVCITAFLWLGAYPSSNFMHQWWTASLTIAAFVACVREMIVRPIRVSAVASFATAALVCVVIAPGVYERLAAGRERAQTLTETFAGPPLFRGIRTDAGTKSAFEDLYRTMMHYRLENPGTRVESIETADGWVNGQVETLPLLSFFNDNTHPHPVYWSLPVLSTSVYPDYTPSLRRRLRTQGVLVVDHQVDRPLEICGYRILAAVASDRGHWYVYAPERTIRVRVATTDAQSSDVPMDPGCSEDSFGPAVTPSPIVGVSGAWRGTVASPSSSAAIRLNKLDIVDPALHLSGRPVDVYTWPSDLVAINLQRTIEPVGTSVSWRAGRDDIVTDLRPGVWVVDGFAQRPYAYLLQWDEEIVAPGSCFVARGVLHEGGLQIGFFENKRWASQITISRPGPFTAVFTFPRSGRYALVLANYVESSLLERIRRYPLQGLLGLLGHGMFPNHFRVDQAGWVRPDAVGAT